MSKWGTDLGMLFLKLDCNPFELEPKFWEADDHWMIKYLDYFLSFLFLFFSFFWALYNLYYWHHTCNYELVSLTSLDG